MDQGEVIGKALRTRTGVRCLYVSVGHRVTLADACRWTLRCSKGYRLPEPTRQGHLRVTRAKKRRTS
jgi:deoxyribonuclease V